MELAKIDPTGKIQSPALVRVTVSNESARYVQLGDAVALGPTGEVLLARGKLEPVVGVVEEIDRRVDCNLKDMITLVTLRITDPPTCLAIKRGDIRKLRVPAPIKSRFELIMEEVYGVSPE